MSERFEPGEAALWALAAFLVALLLTDCGGPILAPAELVEPPIVCRQLDAFECPSARWWADYESNGEPWRECWCKDQMFADFTFPIVAGDGERVRAEWERYRARGCRP